jgi:hypothetical protein
MANDAADKAKAEAEAQAKAVADKAKAEAEAQAKADAAKKSAKDAEMVSVRLTENAPAGRLVVPGFQPIERTLSALIPRSEFERLKADYGLEIAPDEA